MQFDRFIITSRQDKILQAISLIFASESNTWDTDSESSENLNGRDFRQDDTMKICNSMRSLTSNESSWRKLMKKMNITPFEIVYENMCDQPNKTFQKLKDYLKIPELEHVELEASTFKITDPLKALDMKQKFLQDIRALNTSIPDPD
jgi:LPS sulfotransferase NodH